MKRALKIAVALLAIWGGLSLVGVIVLGGFIVYRFGPGNRDKIDSASPHDVRFVLNWCNLGDHRIEKVLHSYRSARALCGDHLDAYAIKISHVTVGELIKDSGVVGWHRGDQLPMVLDEAVAWVGIWLDRDEIEWFPKEEELRSGDIYVYPWSIEHHGLQTTAVKIIFVRPADKTVFFFSGAT